MPWTYLTRLTGAYMLAYMSRFHAHVYFETEQLALARALESAARDSNQYSYAQLYELPVGPHPTGMVELQFNGESYERAVNWISEHRGDFSVLVHQDTGDDVYDHTHNVLWLGDERPIDFSFFKIIETNPELRVHTL